MKYEKIKEQDIVSTFPAVDAVVCNLVLGQVMGLADAPENTLLQRYRTIVILMAELRSIESQARAEALAYLHKNHKNAFLPVDYETEMQYITKTLKESTAPYVLVDGCGIRVHTFAEFKKLRHKDSILNTKMAISDRVYAQFKSIMRDIAQRTKMLMSKKENARVRPRVVSEYLAFEGDTHHAWEIPV